MDMCFPLTSNLFNVHKTNDIGRSDQALCKLFPYTTRFRSFCPSKHVFFKLQPLVPVPLGYMTSHIEDGVHRLYCSEGMSNIYELPRTSKNILVLMEARLVT